MVEIGTLNMLELGIRKNSSTRRFNEWLKIPIQDQFQNDTGRLQTLTEFSLFIFAVYPGRCPGLRISERLRRWFRAVRPISSSSFDTVSESRWLLSIVR